jgi:hypothetical protein
MVLPFELPKEVARKEIERYVSKRLFFAHPTFKKEFCTENVLGVYLPYMVVGINANATFIGQGERTVRSYVVTTGSGNSRRTITKYDADVYNVQRNFDIAIEGLPIISSSRKLNLHSNRTNNIINAIKPFDIENSVRWDSNYLRGFASEKRDTNIENLKRTVNMKAKDVARHQANGTVGAYDRGVRWDRDLLDIKGEQWKAAYFPVWLYSFLQKKGGGQYLLHYVAVNARTMKAMGSVPINKLRLILFSLIVQILGIIASFFSVFHILYDTGYEYFGAAFLASGFIFYSHYYLKYRNVKARFSHEFYTKATTSNVKKYDRYVMPLLGVENAEMHGANNMKVDYKQNAGREDKIAELGSELRGYIFGKR